MHSRQQEQERALALLQQMGVKPHRLRGQNFLIDAAVVRAIMAVFALGREDRALEIGPGLGALTTALAAAAGRLTALEIEPGFAAYLRAQFVLEPGVEIIEADALSFDYLSLYAGAPYRLYANMPYHITTPLLKRLLHWGGNWRSMVLLLQKEAAERIVYGRGKANGPLTLLAAYYAEPRLCFEVPKTAFYPQPQVDSAVICLERRAAPPVAGDIQGIMALAEAAFAERRKLMLNALPALGGDKEYWRQGFTACGIAESSRAEQLDLAAFARLHAWHSGRQQRA